MSSSAFPAICRPSHLVQDLAVSLAHKAAQAEAEEAAKVKATKSAEQQAVPGQHGAVHGFLMRKNTDLMISNDIKLKQYQMISNDVNVEHEQWGNLFGKCSTVFLSPHLLVYRGLSLIEKDDLPLQEITFLIFDDGPSFFLL